MAAYDFPAVASILESDYSRQEGSRFTSSAPAAGPYYTQIISDDVPTFYPLTIVLKSVADAEAFRDWLNADDYAVLTGALFNVDLWSEFGLLSQEAAFTPDGIPQLTSTVRNIYYYSARIVVSRPSGLSYLITTEDGEFLTTESGDLLVT
jgi:hypothetical protein